MSMSAKKLIAASLVSALVFGPISTVAPAMTINAAYAKDRKELRPKKGNLGVIVSQLTNLIATHSLRNSQGYRQASVGTVATSGYSPTALAEAEPMLQDYSVANSNTSADAYVELWGNIDDAQAGFNLAFSEIGSDDLSDPALEYFHNLLSFGDFNAPGTANSEGVEGDLIDSDISDTSLTF